MPKREQPFRGNRVRQLREARGWSGDELARRSGVGDKTVISKIENGKTQLREETMRRIADALECDWRDLLSDGDRKSEEEREMLALFRRLNDQSRLKLRHWLEVESARSSTDEADSNS